MQAVLRATSLQRAINGVQTRNASWVASSIISKPQVEDFGWKNEPVLKYEDGSKERRVLESTLKKALKDTEEVPIIIDGKEYKTDNVRYQVMPFNHKAKLAKFYHATPELINKAIEVSVKAQKEWDLVPMEEKIRMWLKAADLMAGPWRQRLNSVTMLGQAKTVIQAEIDAACELIDFFRSGAYYAKELLKWDPYSENVQVTKNSMVYRGLEGFVAAIAPFNFTAIGGNLAFTPTMMGCSVLWKPSDTAILSNYYIYLILKEVGFPPGVVNFVPSDGPVFGDAITSSPHLAGINFTGSSGTFKHLWKQVGSKVDTYRNFPRIIGECGGKNFHFIHPSADLLSVINCTVRSAFEYSGQKCSACSRIFVPESAWGTVRDGIVEAMKEMQVGDPTDFKMFTSAVIDERSFDRIQGYVDHAKANHTILQGGSYSKKDGYYIQPTFIQAKDPADKLMKEEIFGPVLTAYVYPDKDADKMLTLLDEQTAYALTGAVFAQDEEFLRQASQKLRYAAGNFYINDRSTGSVVNQQPFGGSRLSGTNDKAGGPHYLLRWSTPLTIKETFVPYREWKYPYMGC